MTGCHHAPAPGGCPPARVPTQVCLLNDLFSCFDDLVVQHGVYKVETIGEAQGGAR